MRVRATYDRALNSLNVVACGTALITVLEKLTTTIKQKKTVALNNFTYGDLVMFMVNANNRVEAFQIGGLPCFVDREYEQELLSRQGSGGSVLFGTIIQIDEHIVVCMRV